MNYLPTTLLALSLASLPGLLQAATTGDASRGKVAAGVCVSCHQADGTGKNNLNGESWPQIAGLEAEYIARQLQDYKSGQRENVTMKLFANMLSEQQIADVAQHFSKLAPKHRQGGVNVDETILKRGRMLAEQGDWSNYIVSCKSCHGPDNQGAGAVFPGIAGQHAGYIEAQLKAWQGGTRKNDPQDLMGTIARRMSVEDIQAVAAWLTTQPPQPNREEAQP